MIRRGDKEVTAVYRGGTPIVAVYRGDKVVWQKVQFKGIRGTATGEFTIFPYNASLKHTIIPDANGKFEYELDTSEVTSIDKMFKRCSTLTSLDLSNLDTSKVTFMVETFLDCSALTSLDLSNIDVSRIEAAMNMFVGCNALTRIRCTTTFRDWCWANRYDIILPSAMKSGGSGTWELVD